MSVHLPWNMDTDKQLVLKAISSAKYVYLLSDPSLHEEVSKINWSSRPGYPLCMTPYLKYPSVIHSPGPFLQIRTLFDIYGFRDPSVYDYLCALLQSERILAQHSKFLLKLLVRLDIVNIIVREGNPILSYVHIRTIKCIWKSLESIKVRTLFAATMRAEIIAIQARIQNEEDDGDVSREIHIMKVVCTYMDILNIIIL